AGVAALLGIPGADGIPGTVSDGDPGTGAGTVACGGGPDGVRSAGSPHGPHPLPSGRWWLRVPVPTVDDVLRRALAAGPAVHVHRVQEATPDDPGDPSPPDFGDHPADRPGAAPGDGGVPHDGDRPDRDAGDRPDRDAGDRPGVPSGDGGPA
ncbi:MAG TPA: hypothetical protein VFP72_10840, partial [Kineosporiaceae bacterium]|nr:hypothetical protein [Kineosporiaceae bacterium]